MITVQIDYISAEETLGRSFWELGGAGEEASSLRQLWQKTEKPHSESSDQYRFWQ